jgi:cytochrome b561
MIIDRDYSKIFRLMHWLIAITFVLLLFTIFLRMTWLNKDNVGLIIENFLLEKNISLSHDEVIALAKKIRKPMWEWHIYFGYALTGLYLLRITLGLTKKMVFTNPTNSSFSIKEKFQYFVYIIFYVLSAVSLVTGLLIVHGPKELKPQLEEVHELSIYYLLAFMCIHIGGVLFAEITTSPGIVSKIIRGSLPKN